MNIQNLPNSPLAHYEPPFQRPLKQGFPAQQLQPNTSNFTQRVYHSGTNMIQSHSLSPPRSQFPNPIETPTYQQQQQQHIPQQQQLSPTVVYKLNPNTPKIQFQIEQDQPPHNIRCQIQSYKLDQKENSTVNAVGSNNEGLINSGEQQKTSQKEGKFDFDETETQKEFQNSQNQKGQNSQEKIRSKTPQNDNKNKNKKKKKFYNNQRPIIVKPVQILIVDKELQLNCLQSENMDKETEQFLMKKFNYKKPEQKKTQQTSNTEQSPKSNQKTDLNYYNYQIEHKQQTKQQQEQEQEQNEQEQVKELTKQQSDIEYHHQQMISNKQLSGNQNSIPKENSLSDNTIKIVSEKYPLSESQNSYEKIQQNLTFPKFTEEKLQREQSPHRIVLENNEQQTKIKKSENNLEYLQTKKQIQTDLYSEQVLSSKKPFTQHQQQKTQQQTTQNQVESNYLGNFSLFPSSNTNQQQMNSDFPSNLHSYKTSNNNIVKPSSIPKFDSKEIESINNVHSHLQLQTNNNINNPQEKVQSQFYSYRNTQQNINRQELQELYELQKVEQTKLTDIQKKQLQIDSKSQQSEQQSQQSISFNQNNILQENLLHDPNNLLQKFKECQQEITEIQSQQVVKQQQYIYQTPKPQNNKSEDIKKYINNAEQINFKNTNTEQKRDENIKKIQVQSSKSFKVSYHSPQNNKKSPSNENKIQYTTSSDYQQELQQLQQQYQQQQQQQQLLNSEYVSFHSSHASPSKLQQQQQVYKQQQSNLQSKKQSYKTEFKIDFFYNK